MKVYSFNDKKGKTWWYTPEKNDLYNNRKNLLVDIESLRHIKKKMYRFEEDYINEQLTKRASQLVIEVTENCNMHCDYCIYSGKYSGFRKAKEKPSIIEKEIIKKAIDDFLSRSVYSDIIYLSFYGGEPLLNENAVERIVFAIDYLRENTDKKFKVSLTTNGINLSRFINTLMDKNVYISVSLDGDKYHHNKHRFNSSGGTFDSITENLYRIKSLYPEYYKSNIMFISTLAPPYDFIRRAKFFKESDLVVGKPVIVTFVKPILNNDNEALQENDIIELNQLIDEFYEEILNNNFQLSNFMIGMFGKTLSLIDYRLKNNNLEYYPANGICIPGAKRTFISVNGQMYMCEKIGDNFSLGNVDSGLDVEYAKKLIQEYIEISQVNCDTCWARNFCDLCFVYACSNNKWDIELKNFYCSIKRSFLQICLKLYTSIIAEKGSLPSELSSNNY